MADNKTAEMAGWDFPLLDLELAEIHMDMEQFGFKDFNYNADDSDGKNERIEKEKPPHIITCPHCGKMITLAKDFRVIEG